jgi:hypothetical protein
VELRASIAGGGAAREEESRVGRFSEAVGASRAAVSFPARGSESGRISARDSAGCRAPNFFYRARYFAAPAGARF